MATVKGWSIKASAATALTYILDLKNDQAKTTGGYLVYSSDPRSGPPAFASQTWKRWREERVSKTGQEQKIQAYHFIQSFEPGTVTPEQVFDISRQWTDEMTGNKYPYTLAVHTDKEHLHAHILVHPFENGTGKMWDIYWRKDLAKFRDLSDRICKENGLDVIRPQSKARSYKEWILDWGDGQQEQVRKILEYVVPRVKDYEQFKEVMAKLNFKIEDGSLPAEANKELSAFSFTANQVLFGPEAIKDHYSIRMPKTQKYVQIPKECIRWLYEGQVAAVTVPADKKFETYHFRNDGSIEKEMVDVVKIRVHFEEKDYQKRTRQGLRVKTPYGQRFLKTKYIDSAILGECSLENIKKKIQSTHIEGPEIKRILATDNLEMLDDLRKTVYDKADLHFAKSKSDPWMRRDWYLSYVTARAENTWQMIEWERTMRKEMKSRPELEKNKENLQNEVKNLSDLIEQLEEKVVKMEIDMIERVDGDEPEYLERFIQENLDPLHKTRDDLLREVSWINKNLMELDRFEQYEKRKADREERTR